jgi:hypothetical protein
LKSTLGFTKKKAIATKKIDPKIHTVAVGISFISRQEPKAEKPIVTENWAKPPYKPEIPKAALFSFPVKPILPNVVATIEGVKKETIKPCKKALHNSSRVLLNPSMLFLKRNHSNPKFKGIKRNANPNHQGDFTCMVEKFNHLS